MKLEGGICDQNKTPFGRNMKNTNKTKKLNKKDRAHLAKKSIKKKVRLDLKYDNLFDLDFVAGMIDQLDGREPNYNL